MHIGSRMRMTSKHVLVAGIALCVVLNFGISQAGTTSVDATEKELAVGVKEVPPFVIKRPDGTFQGISVDLWSRIAGRLHLRYRFSERKDVPALLRGTADGVFDAAIAAITVTADRKRLVDFTQPFYSTGLGIAVPTNESQWVAIVRALMSFGFFKAILALLGIALGIGLLIWLFERGRTHHFGRGVKGLGAGVWWSAIAMTQAGAAQNAPATLPGRILGACWMVASVVAIAVFTAGITHTLTKRELRGAVHNVADLRSVRAGTIQSTAAVTYLDRERIAHRSFSQLKDGLEALEAGQIDALVYDKPSLSWMVLQEFPDTLRVLDITFGTQNYAIALPKGSALNDKLTMAILEETEGSWWQQTLFQYLGKRQSRLQETTPYPADHTASSSEEIVLRSE
jgi:ABC-type amino acid transport substrate-binding protein